MDLPSPGGVGVGHRGWVGPTPGAVIACDRPEVALLGSPPPGIEHRDHRLIGKQPARGEQDLAQPGHHGRDLGGGIADPERQGGAVQRHTLTRHDLGLAIQGQVVGVAGYQDMGDQRLGWQATLDQPRRRGGLHHCARASPTGELRPAGHDHPELGGDDVEPLGDVFADQRHRRPAARAGGVLRRQRDLDPRQVCRQRTAARAAPDSARLAQRRVALLGLRLFLGDRLLEVLKTELQLLIGQALGLAAELQAPERQQQVSQPLVLRLQGITFGG
jgi:hypothetical protein